MKRDLYARIRDIEADHWWYVGRRRIVFGPVRRALEANTCARVLDIGCGTGHNLDELRRAGVTDAIGLDVSHEALALCRQRGLRRLVRADGATLPFAAGSFDLILALDVIEHIEDDQAALRGMHDLLAPGGHLILFTPAYRFLWSLQDEVSHHFRRYRRRELRDKLRGAGFDVHKLTYANTFLFPLVLGGRLVLRLRRGRRPADENDLHPRWSNGVLAAIFGAEASFMRHVDLPFGVSLLSVAVRRVDS